MMEEDPTQVILAMDLGGTKLAIAAITSTGNLLARQQEPTSQEGPEMGIGQMVRMLRQLILEARLDPSKIQAIGVGVPAVLEAETDRVIWGPNLPGWKDVPLRQTLEDTLGLPVFLELDGHAAVLGEYWIGCGRGYHSMVDIIVGTGIGGGMILDGQLYRGRDRLAGTAGWLALTVDAESQDERTRQHGFWEALAAGPGFARYVQQQLAAHPDSALRSLVQQDSVVPETVFTAAQQGDQLAITLTHELAGWLGLGIANIVSLLNPELIILGGGLGAHCQFLLPRIREVVTRWAQPISAQSVHIVTSQLGSEAGLFGAAYAAWLRLRENG